MRLSRHGHCVCKADGTTQVPSHYCLKKRVSGVVNRREECACGVLPLSLDNLVCQLSFAWYEYICMDLVAPMAERADMQDP